MEMTFVKGISLAFCATYDDIVFSDEIISKRKTKDIKENRMSNIMSFSIRADVIPVGFVVSDRSWLGHRKMVFEGINGIRSITNRMDKDIMPFQKRVA